MIYSDGHVVIRRDYNREVRRLATGAFALLAVHTLCATGTLHASCSHSVVSRNSASRAEFVDHFLFADLTEPTHNESMPPSRACTGVACSPQPATPAAPSGAVDRLIEFWACCAELTDLDSAFSYDLLATAPAPTAISRGGGVFHPPRAVIAASRFLIALSDAV
jgi:hypothetical protein